MCLLLASGYRNELAFKFLVGEFALPSAVIKLSQLQSRISGRINQVSDQTNDLPFSHRELENTENELPLPVARKLGLRDFAGLENHQTVAGAEPLVKSGLPRS